MPTIADMYTILVIGCTNVILVIGVQVYFGSERNKTSDQCAKVLVIGAQVYFRSERNKTSDQCANVLVIGALVYFRSECHK